MQIALNFHNSAKFWESHRQEDKGFVNYIFWFPGGKKRFNNPKEMKDLATSIAKKAKKDKE